MTFDSAAKPQRSADWRVGSGTDVFALDAIDEGRNRNIVSDFSFGTVSGQAFPGAPYYDFDGTTKGGDDRIRVDTANGDETTIEALKAAAQIRWTQNSNAGWPRYNNDMAKNDTIIYATKGTATTADDIAIMVLEDFTEELTMAMFEVV